MNNFNEGMQSFGIIAISLVTFLALVVGAGSVLIRLGVDKFLRSLEQALKNLGFTFIVIPIFITCALWILFSPIYDVFYVIDKPAEWIIGFVATGTLIGCNLGPIVGWLAWRETKKLPQAMGYGLLVVMASPWMSCLCLTALWHYADC